MSLTGQGGIDMDQIETEASWREHETEQMQIRREKLQKLKN